MNHNTNKYTNNTNIKSPVTDSYKKRKNIAIIPTILGVGATILGGVAAHEVYNAINPAYSSSEAAEVQKTEQAPYFIWGDTLRKIKEGYQNSEDMGREFERIFNEKQMNEFKMHVNTVDNFFRYIASDMSPEDKKELENKKIAAIKISPPTNEEKGYLIVDFEKFGDGNQSRRIPLPRIGVDFNQYMNNLIELTYKYNKFYQTIKAAIPKESLNEKVIDVKEGILRADQEAKKKSIEDFLFESLERINFKIPVFYMDKTNVTKKEYNYEGVSKENLADKISEDLNLPNMFTNMALIEGLEGILCHNAVFEEDYKHPVDENDGKNKVEEKGNKRKMFFDDPNGEESPISKQRIGITREDITGYITDNPAVILMGILNNGNLLYMVSEKKENGKGEYIHGMAAIFPKLLAEKIVDIKELLQSEGDEYNGLEISLAKYEREKETKPEGQDGNGDDGNGDDGNGDDGNGEICTTETFDDDPSIAGTGDTTQYEDETGVDATLDDGAPEYDGLMDSLKTGGTSK